MRRYVVLPRPLLCRKSAKTGHRWNGVKVSAGDGSEGIDKCLPLAHTAMRGITRSHLFSLCSPSSKRRSSAQSRLATG